MRTTVRSPATRLVRLALTDMGIIAHVIVALGLTGLAFAWDLSGAGALMASAVMLAVSLALARTPMASPIGLGVSFVVFTVCAGWFVAPPGGQAGPPRRVTEYRVVAPALRPVEPLALPEAAECDAIFEEAEAACFGVFGNALDAARVRLNGTVLAAVVRVTAGCRQVAQLRGRQVPHALLGYGSGLALEDIATFDEVPPRHVLRELRRRGAHAARIEWVKVFLAANHPALPRAAAASVSITDLANDYETLAR